MLADMPPLHGDDDAEDNDNYDGVVKQVFATLNEINLETEIAEQYSSAKYLYARVENLRGFSPNQKAAVLNSITSIITKLKDAQAEVYNINMVKCIESAIIKTVQSLAPDAQELFWKEYEANLAASNQRTS